MKPKSRRSVRANDSCVPRCSPLLPPFLFLLRNGCGALISPAAEEGKLLLGGRSSGRGVTTTMHIQRVGCALPAEQRWRCKGRLGTLFFFLPLFLSPFLFLLLLLSFSFFFLLLRHTHAHTAIPTASCHLFLRALGKPVSFLP